MRLLITFTLLSICFTASAQTSRTKKEIWGRPDTLFASSSIRKETLTYYPGSYIGTESVYTDSTGIAIIIQNSLPKGGGYTDPAGKEFGYRMFWNRVINESAAPIEITINFPADSFAIPTSSDSYFRVLLPPDTMTLDKEGLFSYGATGLIPFLDKGLHTPTMLKRTINPNDAYQFYVVVLSYQPKDSKFTIGGGARTELILKGQDFFYLIKHADLGLIPCGKIVLKK